MSTCNSVGFRVVLLRIVSISHGYRRLRTEHSTDMRTKSVHGEFAGRGTAQLTNETDSRNLALIELTADIVAAFVQNNAVPVTGLPDLISSVNTALAALGKPDVVEQPASTPAVNPKRSVFPDHIISLEDGRKFKSMKRHLGLLGMTPDEYRKKWGLPSDYPMVAPSYAARRSELAKTIGLRRKAGSKVVPERGLPKKGRKQKVV